MIVSGGLKTVMIVDGGVGGLKKDIHAAAGGRFSRGG